MNNQKVFLSFITYILLFNASAFPQYNSVRIAFSPNSSIPDNFLERAINAGYNYIEQGFNVSDASEWEDGSYLYFTNHNAPHNLLNNIRDAFIRVHNFGVQKKVSLKLIPRIAFGGRFSEHLRLTGDDIDWAPVYKVNLENRIKHNAYQNDESFGLVLANWLGLFTLGPEETKIQSNCPSYCVERGGKTCFSELMKILATAFDLAKSDPATNEPHTFPDYLEFIDIDHGEPYAVDENPVDRKYHVFPGLSLSDQWWMWDNLGSGCGLNWDDGRFLVPVPQPGDCWHCEIAYGGSGWIPCTTGDCFRILKTVYNVSGAAYFWTAPDGSIIDEGKGAGCRFMTGTPTPEAIQRLIAHSLEWKVQAAENTEVHGNPGSTPLDNTKLIMWADLLDPEYMGGFHQCADAVTFLKSEAKEKLVFLPFRYVDVSRNPIEITTSNEMGTFFDGDPGATVYGDIDMDHTGHRYDPYNTLEFFCEKGCNVMYTFSLTYPGYSSDKLYEQMIAVLKQQRAMEDIKQLFPDQVLGYLTTPWRNETADDDPNIDDPSWDNNEDLYNQNFKFNILEITSGLFQNSNGGFPHPAGTGQTNATFFGRMTLIPGDINIPSFLCDRFEVRNIDYLVANQDYFYPDIDELYAIKDEISFCDAILYCNNLSVRDGLEEVYSFTTNLNDERFVETSPETYTFDRSIINDLEGLTADFTKSGYRLLTSSEMTSALFSGLITIDPSVNGEWIWVPDPSHPSKTLVTANGFYGWAYHAGGSYSSYPHNDATLGMTFRICSNTKALPSTITISGQNDVPYVVAKDLVLIQDTDFDPSVDYEYISGETIRVLPETIIPQGTEMKLKIDNFIY